MIGPVLASELRRSLRGRRFHAARWIYGGWLTLAVGFAFLSYFTGVQLRGPGDTSRFAHGLVDWLVFQQTVVLLLAAPTFAAGSVTDEKVRGTLEPLFLAHLRPGTIIFAKLIARVILCFVWGLAAWPMIAFVGVPGGVAPVFFAALALITLLMLFGVCGLSLLVSVWSRGSRDAVVATYLLLGAGAFAVIWAQGRVTAVPALRPVVALNPHYVLDTARDRPDLRVLGERLRWTALSWMVVGSVTSLVAAWRLRPAFVKQQQARAKPLYWRIASRPPIPTDEPLTWKEQFVSRGPPRWILCLVISAGAVAWVMWLDYCLIGVDEVAIALFNSQWFVLGLVSLVVGVRASGCVVTERDRQTWDTLLTTPLEFEAILRQKLAGIYRTSWVYYFAFLAPALATVSWLSLAGSPEYRALLLFISVLGGVAGMVLTRALYWPVAPAGLIMLSLGCGAWTGPVAIVALIGPLLMFTVMEFIGGIGAWCSVRARNGWIALLGTVVGGYVLGSIMVVCTVPLMCLSLCVLSALIAMMDQFVSGINPAGGFSRLMVAITVGAGLPLFWFGRMAFQGAVRYLRRNDRVTGGFVRLIDLNLPYTPPMRPDFYKRSAALLGDRHADDLLRIADEHLAVGEGRVRPNDDAAPG